MAMRCKRCRGAAVMEVRRHNAAFCRDCFLHYVGQQVTRAIAKYRMLGHTDRVLVAVSGGKDSLALWDLLLELGYQADGLYLSLGIGAYSERSKAVCQEFAADRGATLLVHDLAGEHGYTIPEAASKGGRSSCGVCGLSKRYVFNRAALDGGYDVVCTGHNLDDEAAVLFGNTLRWDTARHGPPVPRPRGDPPRPGQEGQAAVPGGRARDRRLLRAQGHRLRGRGVPAGRRQHPDAPQGDPQPDGGGGPRHQAQLPVRLPGPGRRPAQGGRRRRPDRVRPLRHDHPGPRGPGRRGGLRLLPLQGPPGQAPPGGRGQPPG